MLSPSTAAQVEDRTDSETRLLTNAERIALLWQLYDALLTNLLAALTPEGDRPPPTAAVLDISRKVLVDHGIKASAMRTTGDVKRGLEALVVDLGALPFGKDKPS